VRRAASCRHETELAFIRIGLTLVNADKLAMEDVPRWTIYSNHKMESLMSKTSALVVIGNYRRERDQEAKREGRGPAGPFLSFPST
jgi:hypothetical protein